MAERFSSILDIITETGSPVEGMTGRGRLCGEVVNAAVDELKGCKVVAIYKLRFKASEKGGGGDVEGTLEGMVICPCLVP